ncbi:MAG: hypothetical protein ABIP97_06635, partial [Chthoniobacterales bacterium]
LTNARVSLQEIDKLLSVPGYDGTTGTTVFAVTKSDPDKTVLFAQNWPGSPAYQANRGFTVMLKNGDGKSYPKSQSANMDTVGSGGMFNYLPLK